MNPPKRRWDVFICHASEDKREVADPLFRHLKRRGLTTWFDEIEIGIGDSIRERIDQGLTASRFGVVVLSRAFFRKKWAMYELDGLVTKESRKSRLIIPVWHKVTHADVKKFSLSLANRKALSTAVGIPSLATQIAEKVIPVHHSPSSSASRKDADLRTTILRRKVHPAYRPSVLVIDDDAKVSWILSERVEDFGFRRARDGIEGLQMIAQEEPDIVLLDLRMPKLGGLEVLKEIRNRNLDLDVIIISGHGDTDNVVNAIKLGAVDFINKPFDPLEVRLRLLFALRNRLFSDD